MDDEIGPIEVEREPSTVDADLVSDGGVVVDPDFGVTHRKRFRVDGVTIHLDRVLVALLNEGVPDGEFVVRSPQLRIVRDRRFCDPVAVRSDVEPDRLGRLDGVDKLCVIDRKLRTVIGHVRVDRVERSLISATRCNSDRRTPAEAGGCVAVHGHTDLAIVDPGRRRLVERRVAEIDRGVLGNCFATVVGFDGDGYRRGGQIGPLYRAFGGVSNVDSDFVARAGRVFDVP
ncbi:hypothetical protein [Natronoarchaeum rubrum]|uniref:hypothetical protein n=1 Tax=Natronoarchaeum rubrum TaxID=755311 RepID=UPI0021131E10|nr:hypothetical protein [Natronoarchaeum rubrum]